MRLVWIGIFGAERGREREREREGEIDRESS